MVVLGTRLYDCRTAERLPPLLRRNKERDQEYNQSASPRGRVLCICSNPLGVRTEVDGSQHVKYAGTVAEFCALKGLLPFNCLRGEN